MISLLCPKRAQSSRHVHLLTLGCPRCGGHWLTCMMASFLNTHEEGDRKRRKGQQGISTNLPFQASISPCSTFQLSSSPSHSLFIHFALTHSPAFFSHIHTAHAHFPTKRLFSGPHAGWMFLMTLMPAAHQHDATNPMTFSASSSQPRAHRPREKEGKEDKKGKTRD